jgi:hypothetical protein
VCELVKNNCTVFSLLALQECNHFKAGNKVRSTVSCKKLAVTGVFGSVCKHEIPITFCDMSHGER